MKSVSIIGSGALASVFYRNFSRLGASWKVVNVFSHVGIHTDAFEKEFGVKVITDIDEFYDNLGDFVIEFAGVSAVKELCLPVLKKGKNFVCVSVGALADQEFLKEIEKTASENGSAVYVPNGAIGGLDVLQALSLSGEDYEIGIQTVKSPKGLKGAPGLAGRELSQTTKEIVFQGNCEQAIAGFPKNVNVAVATSLASNCPDTVVTLVSDPTQSSNSHTISVTSQRSKTTLRFENFPDPKNPKSSTITAYSVLALLKNLSSPVRFF